VEPISLLIALSGCAAPETGTPPVAPQPGGQTILPSPAADWTPGLPQAVPESSDDDLALGDPVPPTLVCDRTVLLSEDRQQLGVLATHEDILGWLDPQALRLDQLSLDEGPTRLDCAGDRIFVTLRGSGAVAELDLVEGTPTLLTQAQVGAEPYGIAVRADGQRLYVALSQEDAVVELDADTLTELRRFPVTGDPRWLVLHPDDQHLYVLSAYDRDLYTVDLVTGSVLAQALPVVQGVQDLTTLQGEVDLVGRFTGDPDVSPDGEWLVLPSLQVNNDASSDATLEGSTTVTYYGGGSTNNPPPGMARFNPNIVKVPLAWGEPVPDESEFLDIKGEVERSDESTQFGRSYLTQVTFSPDGQTLATTMEGSDLVALVRLTYSAVTDPIRGVLEHPIVLIDAPLGPRAVAWADEATLVGDFQVAGTAGALDVGAAVDWLLDEDNQRGAEAATMLGFAGLPVRPATDPELDEGRRLFTSAVAPEIVQDGTGASCATCHYEGRTDGLEWFQEHGPRQTPSLAGDVDATAPVTWADEVDSVATEATLTATTRLGGDGPSPSQAAAMARWINLDRLPARPAGDPDAIARGRTLFLSQDVGCAGCHVPPLYTDPWSYDLLGNGAMNTPSLLGIGASGPYLHDGSAATLRDVLDLAVAGWMGETADLDEADLQDLVAFLESL